MASQSQIARVAWIGVIGVIGGALITVIGQTLTAYINRPTYQASSFPPETNTISSSREEDVFSLGGLIYTAYFWVEKGKDSAWVEQGGESAAKLETGFDRAQMIVTTKIIPLATTMGIQNSEELAGRVNRAIDTKNQSEAHQALAELFRSFRGSLRQYSNDSP